VALMDWCLQQAGVGADALVVDTHMGSGTTALACLRRGVRFAGIEIDPVHFQTAMDRLRNEHEKLTLGLA
jgi:site-specific DNA-methyltransferase (adenine-specific)